MNSGHGNTVGLCKRFYDHDFGRPDDYCIFPLVKNRANGYNSWGRAKNTMPNPKGQFF